MLPLVLTTLRTPPYETKEEALIQYSYWESVDTGLPKVLIKSCSVSTSVGRLTGPLAKGATKAPTFSATATAPAFDDWSDRQDAVCGKGSDVRLKAGQQRTVELVDYAGDRTVIGFRGLYQRKL